MQEPLENAELLAFVKAVDAQSLSRAALELGVPRATLGRRLARLEERLGTRLLRRTTRSLVLTDAGQTLYQHARIVLDAVGQAEASVRSAERVMRGVLRIAVPPFAHFSFYEMICTFAARYPELRVEVHSSTRHVDLQRDGFDVAIRGSLGHEPGLVARSLLRVSVIAVASPAYLAGHGTPTRPRDLRDHRCLMGFARGELPQTTWTSRSGANLHLEGALFANDIVLLGEAARRGLGIAFLPSFVVDPCIETGELVQVLKGSLEAQSDMAVVYPERAFLPPQVRAFVDTVLVWAKGEIGRGGALIPPMRPSAPVTKPSPTSAPKSTSVAKKSKPARRKV